ncbi:Nuclear transcription factor Y subunit B-9 [Bienertia sinuspersici]
MMLHAYPVCDGLNSKINNIQAQTPCSKTPLAPNHEHELYMPVANVGRIMRRALPSHAKVADESKVMMQECVSKFINFITSEANESCQLEHRKTITAEDVIRAMSRLGFDHYVQPLSMYLQKHRENEMYPSIPRRNVGNMDTEATVVTPTTNVLPPFPMVHPHVPLSRAASNGGTYHNGSGSSTGPITMGQCLETATNSDGSGLSLAFGIGGGPNNNKLGVHLGHLRLD